MIVIPRKITKWVHVRRTINEIIDCLARMRPRSGVNVMLTESESGTQPTPYALWAFTGMGNLGNRALEWNDYVKGATKELVVVGSAAVIR